MKTSYLLGPATNTSGYNNEDARSYIPQNMTTRYRASQPAHQRTERSHIQYLKFRQAVVIAISNWGTLLSPDGEVDDGDAREIDTGIHKSSDYEIVCKALKVVPPGFVRDSF